MLAFAVLCAWALVAQAYPEPVPYQGHRHCACEVEDDHHDDQEQAQERFGEVEHHLMQLIAKVEHLSDEFDHMVHEREEARVKASNLKLRMAKQDHLGGCPKGQYRCASTNEQCVQDILVCDGHDDCDDGSDEDDHVCTDPVPVGAVFKGRPLFDHCTQRRPHHVEIDIIADHHDELFTIRKHVDARLYMESDHDDWHAVTSLPLSGYYYYAKHELIFDPPESDRLGIIVHFEPGHDEIMVAHVMEEFSDEDCAEFDMHRVYDHHSDHYNDHHDDDDHDDHHNDDHHDDHHDDDHHDDHHDDDHHDDHH